MQAAQQQGYPRWRLWAQDESRGGLLPILRRRITARGVQPLLPAAYRFESLYLYGTVEPLTGESFFLELPLLNTQGFQLFLDHFAAADPVSFHLLLLDTGAFHQAQSLRLPRNVGLIFFLPYAPELNPLERLWRDLKDWLSRHQPPRSINYPNSSAHGLSTTQPRRFAPSPGSPIGEPQAHHVLVQLSGRNRITI